MRFPNWFSSQTPSLRSQILNDPYYRFRSLSEVRLAVELGVQIDVNQASVDDWLRLPGLSIHQARSLVALSQSGVQFHSLEDVAAALSVPVQRLQPIAPLLRFCYYDSESPGSIQLVDPNVASVEWLTRVPAIDLFLAKAIVQNRQIYGKYRNMADLQKRLSLSGQLIAEIMHYLRIG